MTHVTKDKMLFFSDLGGKSEEIHSWYTTEIVAPGWGAAMDFFFWQKACYLTNNSKVLAPVAGAVAEMSSRVFSRSVETIRTWDHFLFMPEASFQTCLPCDISNDEANPCS